MTVNIFRYSTLPLGAFQNSGDILNAHASNRNKRVLKTQVLFNLAPLICGTHMGKKGDHPIFNYCKV